MNMMLVIASLLYLASFGIGEEIMVSFNISPVIKDVKIPVDINLDEGAALKTVISEPVDPFASSPVLNINIDPGKIRLSVLVTAGAEIKEATIDVGNSSETYYTLPLCFNDKPSELSSLEYVRVTSSSDFISDKVIVFSWAKFNCSKDLTGIDSSTTSKQINEESGLNTGIIVVGVASGIALLIIVVIISYVSYKKRNIARDGNEMEMEIGMGPSSTDIDESIKFVEASGGSVPHNAFPGGQDRSGETLYIGRAMHEGSKIPGKLHPSHGVLYVAWGGREHKKTHYEVLVQKGDDLIWIIKTEASDMATMGAIPGGYEADGSPLYIGRAQIDGKWTVGKVSPKYNVCYVPHGGKEHEEIQYQVLCAKGPSDNEPVKEAGVAGGGIPNWVTGLALGVPVAAALAYDLFGPGGDDEIKENPVKATEISEKPEKRERR